MLGITATGALTPRLTVLHHSPDNESLVVRLAAGSDKAHNQRFSVRCRVDDVDVEGTGTSRRNAEQQAAERMLEQLAT